jgi:hypothetical protein
MNCIGVQCSSGVVRGISRSGPGPDPEPEISAKIGMFAYVINSNLHSYQAVNHKKHCECFCGRVVKAMCICLGSSYVQGYLSSLVLQ